MDKEFYFILNYAKVFSLEVELFFDWKYFRWGI